MKIYSDTSFLCAIYRLQANSSEAAAYFAAMSGPLEVTTLLLYEFRQAVRFQIRLHRLNPAKGYSRAEGIKMLADLKSDLVSGDALAADPDGSANSTPMRVGIGPWTFCMWQRPSNWAQSNSSPLTEIRKNSLRPRAFRREGSRRESDDGSYRFVVPPSGGLQIPP